MSSRDSGRALADFDTQRWTENEVLASTRTLFDECVATKDVLRQRHATAMLLRIVRTHDCARTLVDERLEPIVLRAIPEQLG